jgi:hypothetical protein
MNRKGVLYDVGRVLGGNWRPHFDPNVIHRELSIIKNDLHCTAVKICGLDITRLMVATEDALTLGLEVWLSPEMWNKGQKQTLTYLVKAARAAESRRERWPERIVFSVGTEATVFQQGFLKGRNHAQRTHHPSLREQIRSGMPNQLLNAFLRAANEAVRGVFRGLVTYSSVVPIETVDWSLFDYVCIDVYRGRYLTMSYGDFIAQYFRYGKPVIIGEFGCCTYQGAEDAGSMGGDIVDWKTFFLPRVPLVGRLVRPRLKGDYVRDEDLQARELNDQFTILDNVGVDGAFLMTFVSPNWPYHECPRNDLDMASYSLVKSYADGKHGFTYPDMLWEPKESFRAVADYYAAH